MESNIGLWFNSCFWNGNCAAKSKSAWMLCTVTLLLQWRPSKIAITSFNVVAHRFLMSHAQVPRKRLPQRITWQKSTISYCWPPIEDTRDSSDSRHVKRLRGSYPAWNFVHEKAVGAMGAAFAHSGQETQQWDHLLYCLTLFKRNPKEFLSRFVTVDETWIHGYTPETNSRNSGLHPANLLQRRRRLSHRPERWWPPFFGSNKVWSTSTTWRRAKRSQGGTMPNYWADSPPNRRK